MRSTAERRCKILLILCERHSETMGNLSFELSVDRSTIQRDVEILSASFPLYTTKNLWRIAIGSLLFWCAIILSSPL